MHAPVMSKQHVLAALIGCSALMSACGTSGADAEVDGVAAAETSGDAAVDGEPTCPTGGDVWDVAKVYIEHNATDEDTGIHGLIGGAPWETVCVTASDGTQLWTLEPPDRLGALGVSDFFWESNEPPNAEYSIADLRSDFPEGTYGVAGTGIDGIDRVAEAVFTHDIPAAPWITNPPLIPDIEAGDPPVVDGTGLVVRWEPVTETIDGTPVTITGYEVIVTEEEADDPNGWARPIYDVHVDSDVTALAVPEEFVKDDTLYELEVLAIEPSGNQTISVGFFRTS